MLSSMCAGEAELKFYGCKTVVTPCGPSGHMLPSILPKWVEALTGFRLNNVKTHAYACTYRNGAFMCLVPAETACVLYIIEIHDRWIALTAPAGVPLNVLTKALYNNAYHVCSPGAVELPALGRDSPERTSWTAAPGVFRVLVVPLRSAAAAQQCGTRLPDAVTGSMNPAADAPTQVAWCHMLPALLSMANTRLQRDPERTAHLLEVHVAAT